MKDVKALKLMTLNDVLSQINGDMTLGNWYRKYNGITLTSNGATN